MCSTHKILQRVESQGNCSPLWEDDICYYVWFGPCTIGPGCAVNQGHHSSKHNLEKKVFFLKKVNIFGAVPLSPMLFLVYYFYLQGVGLSKSQHIPGAYNCLLLAVNNFGILIGHLSLMRNEEYRQDISSIYKHLVLAQMSVINQFLYVQIKNNELCI